MPRPPVPSRDPSALPDQQTEEKKPCSGILDVAVGLAVIYLLLSTLCSTINEAIARYLALRAKNLEEGIRALLRDDMLAARLHAHPLIEGLCRPKAGARSRTCGTTGRTAAGFSELSARIRATGLPLGWELGSADAEQSGAGYGGWTFGAWVLEVLGIGLSVFAVALGAPFWFDVLNEFVNLRGSGTKPKPATE